MTYFENLPSELHYLVTKARMYLQMGPKRFRTLDAFQMPLADTTPEELQILKSGMEQLVSQVGWSPDDPFTGLGINGFYLLMATLHFTLDRQSLHSSTGAVIVEQMCMAHRVTGQKIVLYNAVSVDGYG